MVFLLGLGRLLSDMVNRIGLFGVGKCLFNLITIIKYGILSCWFNLSTAMLISIIIIPTMLLLIISHLKPNHTENTVRSCLKPNHTENTLRSCLKPNHTKNELKSCLKPNHTENELRSCLKPNHTWLSIMEKRELLN